MQIPARMGQPQMGHPYEATGSFISHQLKALGPLRTWAPACFGASRLEAPEGLQGLLLGIQLRLYFLGSRLYPASRHFIAIRRGRLAAHFLGGLAILQNRAPSSLIFTPWVDWAVKKTKPRPQTACFSEPDLPPRCQVRSQKRLPIGRVITTKAAPTATGT